MDLRPWLSHVIASQLWWTEKLLSNWDGWVNLYLDFPKIAKQ